MLAESGEGVPDADLALFIWLDVVDGYRAGFSIPGFGANAEVAHVASLPKALSQRLKRGRCRCRRRRYAPAP
jgi:hypothetical protein